MKQRILHIVATLTLVCSAALLGSACAHEGPAQRAGRHLDNAADDVKHDLKSK